MFVRTFAWLMCFGLVLQSFPAWGDDEPESDATEATADPYALPEGTDRKEILSSVNGMLQRQLPTRTPAALLDHYSKIDQAIEQLSARDIDDETLEQLVNLRYQQLLPTLDRMGHASAADTRKSMLKSLQESDQPARRSLARRLALQDDILRLAQMGQDEQDQLVGTLAEEMAQPGGSRGAIPGLAMRVGRHLEVSDPARAVSAYEGFLSAAKSQSDPDSQNLVERLQGALRRARLFGNPIEVVGETIDSKPFNISDYAGKVVLVDFWATWCGPCIAELPHVKKLYEAYHDKGFEVVGISLDRDVDQLKQFIAEKDLPWVQLYDPENQKGWDNRIAVSYGITAIPTVILVDRDGNVCHLNARGENLTTELERLLGPPDPPAEEDEKPEADAAGN